MRRGPTDPREREGWDVLLAATREAEKRLGDDLLSVYALGSLAHGGFAPAVSDVDLALLTTESTPDMTRLVADVTAAVSDTHALGQRLSVFHCPWTRFAAPPVSARFPPIDRFDLVRYGILVAGTDLRGTYAVAPTAEAIHAQAVDSALRRITPRQLAHDVEQLRAGGVTVHDATKIVLWPIRLQHVCDCGEATGNADAVRHYLSLADAAHHQLARDALSWRDLDEVPRPAEALGRITTEIHSLHAEVFRRLTVDPGSPRRDEMADRARQIFPGGR